METTTTFHPCLVLSWFMVVPVRAWCRRSGPLEGRSVLWGENEMAEKGRNRAAWEVGGWIFISLVVVAKCGVLLVVHARERTIEGNTE